MYHPFGNYSSIMESGNNQVEWECIHGFPFPTLVASLRLNFAYILAIAYISCDLGSGAKFSGSFPCVWTGVASVQAKRPFVYFVYSLYLSQ